MTDEFGADAVRHYRINSPLVRAANPNFSKDGVKGIIRDIFLPWYNAYRFLIDNIGRMEMQEETKFAVEENLSALKGKFNITDSWILSSVEVLLKDVRYEMESYKLYNVTPKLVAFLELLTNWYVRLNRSRLRGGSSTESMQIGLNVLFQVLMKINVLMSPLVPFITEYMYQNMRRVGGKSLSEESIHYLLIDEPKEELIQLDII